MGVILSDIALHWGCRLLSTFVCLYFLLVAGPAAAETLQVRVTEDASLQQVVEKAGYAISDRNMEPFLRDFMRNNEKVRSLSRIKKGTLLHLPTSRLEKTGRKTDSGIVKQTAKPLRRKSAPAVASAGSATGSVNSVEAPAARSAALTLSEKPAVQSSVVEPVIFNSIKELADELFGGVATETSGLRFFAVGEKTEISIDASFFPMLVMNNGGVLVFDPSGILPEEVRQIVHVMWPEYTFVSYSEGYDLKKLIGSLLSNMGYSVLKDRSFIAGGRSKIEYTADFLIVGNSGDLISGDIAAVTVSGPHERELPASLKKWLRDRDIRLVTVRGSARPAQMLLPSGLADMRSIKDNRYLAEKLIVQLGYQLSRDVVLRLSDRKEFSYTLKADIAIDAGARKKVLEFAKLSDPEISYARRQGVDIVTVDAGDDRSAIIGKLVNLLGVIHSDAPERYTSYITPRQVPYRLYLPGIFVKSPKGAFILTDSELEPELLRDIIEPSVGVVTY